MTVTYSITSIKYVKVEYKNSETITLEAHNVIKATNNSEHRYSCPHNQWTCTPISLAARSTVQPRYTM